MIYRDGWEAEFVSNQNDDYDKNIGKAGVVYILINEAFKDDWLKIGCTTHDGHTRATQINKETKALTGLPAELACIFQISTEDCGTAERRVHHRLRHYRRGKHGTKRDGSAWGQEWFYVDLEKAKQVINDECWGVDQNRESAFGPTVLPGEADPKEKDVLLDFQQKIAGLEKQLDTYSKKTNQSKKDKTLITKLEEKLKNAQVERDKKIAELEQSFTKKREEDLQIQQAILHVRYHRRIAAQNATISHLVQATAQQNTQALKRAAVQQKQAMPAATQHLGATQKHKQQQSKPRMRRPKKASLIDAFFVGLFVVATVVLVGIGGLYVARKSQSSPQVPVQPRPQPKPRSFLPEVIKVCAGEVSKVVRYPTIISTAQGSKPNTFLATIQWKHGRNTTLTLKQNCNPKVASCNGPDQHRVLWVIYPRPPHGSCKKGT